MAQWLDNLLFYLLGLYLFTWLLDVYKIDLLKYTIWQVRADAATGPVL